jgi:hypothetical protein
MSATSPCAQGQLCQLDISQKYVNPDVLLPVLTANAGSLRDLHLRRVSTTADGYSLTVHAAVAAAPLLQVIASVGVTCTWEDAPRVLRAEPPFALLRMRHILEIRFDNAVNFGGMERVGQLAAAEDRGAFGDALAALIAVDAPALQVLVCRDNFLGDAGLAPIVEALPLNRHLRELDVSDNDMSEAFARERLLPAVRANTTLRELNCGHSSRAAADAVELVRRRGQPD